MVRGNIAATFLKMLWKNLYSVKYNDKLNMNVFTLSLWENFWWGLIYFDQFICHVICVSVKFVCLFLNIAVVTLILYTGEFSI